MTHPETTALAFERLAAHPDAPRLFQDLLDVLHRMAARHMRKQAPGHTLQTTALVNEAFLKMTGIRRLTFSTESEFVAFASRTMRSVMVDHARRKSRVKRRPRGTRISFEDLPATPPRPVNELIDVGEALDELAREGQNSARSARVVELRYFSGFTEREVATLLGVSERTVERDWRYACVWLRERIG